MGIGDRKWEPDYSSGTLIPILWPFTTWRSSLISHWSITILYLLSCPPSHGRGGTFGARWAITACGVVWRTNTGHGLNLESVVPLPRDIPVSLRQAPSFFQASVPSSVKSGVRLDELCGHLPSQTFWLYLPRPSPFPWLPLDWNVTYKCHHQLLGKGSSKSPAPFWPPERTVMKTSLFSWHSTEDDLFSRF